MEPNPASKNLKQKSHQACMVLGGVTSPAFSADTCDFNVTVDPILTSLSNLRHLFLTFVKVEQNPEKHPQSSSHSFFDVLEILFFLKLPLIKKVYRYIMHCIV